jgi:hypothetical protein
VFISENFDDAQKLVVLIHGSGAVQAGQWSRRLAIINDFTSCTDDDASLFPD